MELGNEKRKTKEEIEGLYKLYKSLYNYTVNTITITSVIYNVTKKDSQMISYEDALDRRVRWPHKQTGKLREQEKWIIICDTQFNNISSHGMQ